MTLRALLDKLGTLGTAAIGILLFNASFYAGNISPAIDDLATIKQKITEINTKLGTNDSLERKKEPQEIPALPLVTESDHLSEQLGAIAEKAGLRLNQASFRRINESGQVRIEATIPLKADYPHVRQFMRDAMALGPSTLDNIELHRAGRAETTVDTQIVLSYYFSTQ